MVTNINNIYKSYLPEGQGSPKMGTEKGETKDGDVSDNTAGYAEDNVILELSNFGSGELKTTEDMETKTYGGKVAVNEGKRLRQIASAKTAAQVQAVIGLLNKDLSDCESGRARGMCDDDEIKKVKALLQKAAQRMSEVSNTENDEEEKGFDAFTINMLM